MLNKDSCLGKKDKSITLEQAKNQCISSIKGNLNHQQVDIYSALNRILAEDIIAPNNVPPFKNSAMDGYAIYQDDLDAQKPLDVIACVYAGSVFDDKIEKGQCVKIMTGAIIPPNVDFVIPQEYVKEVDKNQILIHEYFGASNIRMPGEDLKKDSVVIEKGRLIQASDLGLLASLGIEKIYVYKKLRVAFLSTGDELCSLDEKLTPGKIYNSNRYCLYGLLKKLNIEMFDIGIVKDNIKDLKAAFLKASNIADVVITTGGVSVGEADFVKLVLEELGNINFWKLAIKPGRPLTFGNIENTYFFGLPGNPVAVMITFYQIVQPFIKTMAGQKENIEPLLVSAISLSNIVKRPGRREFIRAQLLNKEGVLSVKKLSKQGSGILSSISNANCLIVLTEESGAIKVGEVVQVQLFHGLST